MMKDEIKNMMKELGYRVQATYLNTNTLTIEFTSNQCDKWVVFCEIVSLESPILSWLVIFRFVPNKFLHIHMCVGSYFWTWAITSLEGE